MADDAATLPAVTTPAESTEPSRSHCRHCGAVMGGGAEFCCAGCAAAFEFVRSLGLEKFYALRTLDPNLRLARPEPSVAARDVSRWVHSEGKDKSNLIALVDGLHCGACMWLIEQTLLRQPGVLSARVSLATRRLSVTWHTGTTTAETLIETVERLGYRLVPYSAEFSTLTSDAEGTRLLRSMAVAGFAAGNIMLFSISIWSGESTAISPATRDLFHWLSALIAIPAIAYAGRPFFRSAFLALRSGRTNMDVPISLAILLAPAVSLYETFTSGTHAYFDSAVTLLFFLLIGRYLDHRVRRRARLSAEHLLANNETSACVLDEGDGRRYIPSRELSPGLIALVSPGSRIPGDGFVIEGMSDVDASLVNGESVPQRVSAGSLVYAGTLNLTGPLRVRIRSAGDDTLLAEIIRLIEAAENAKNRYVRVADKVSRYYAPVVHLTALASFLGWTVVGAMAWQDALMVAISVLIITCPCALALAVPVVQVVASQRLMRAGILLKSGDALERLANVDHVVLDKTGTLTLGRPTPADGSNLDRLRVAATIAANSNHPLARAIAAAHPTAHPAAPVEELPGQGLVWHSPRGDWRLGSAAFAGNGNSVENSTGSSVFLRDPVGGIDRFDLVDRLRPDAKEACAELCKELGTEILSGDATPVVSKVAATLGIDRWRAKAGPTDKVERLRQLTSEGHHVLMVGDGLNDAPSLALASVSMAPATGADLAQVKADVIFQGDRLGSVPLAIRSAKAANRLMRQNLVLALVYNLAAIPLAVAGFVTPLVAALAMSSSSILVVGNAMRLNYLK